MITPCDGTKIHAQKSSTPKLRCNLHVLSYFRLVEWILLSVAVCYIKTLLSAQNYD